MKRDILLKIDSNSHRIEYCLIEGINLRPDVYFRFVDGSWLAKFKNFPIGVDNDLDILIIVAGNPGTDSVLSVEIGDAKAEEFSLYRPFNKNGYGQFDQHIEVN
jgi:hypothetical protein